jgi:hypothetical protein
LQKFDHSIGSWEKGEFFGRRLAKIVENCDHNIGPRQAIHSRKKRIHRKLNACQDHTWIFYMYTKVIT